MGGKDLVKRKRGGAPWTSGGPIQQDRKIPKEVTYEKGRRKFTLVGKKEI